MNLDVGLEIIIAISIGIIATVFGVYTVVIYNGLVRSKNNITKSWANIDVLLKQRSDELPKLMDSVKGYMEYEKELMANLTNARTMFLNAKTIPEKIQSDNMITGALKSLFAVAENYPNLKANESFLQLQNRISGIENELADRREFYNDTANEYNIRIQSFPDMYIARTFGFKQPQTMFKVEDKEKDDVKIKF